MARVRWEKNGDEKSRENRHKDPKTKMKPKNIGDINSHDLEKSIAGVLLTIDKCKGKGSLEEKEVQKHHDAIIATVNKTTAPINRKHRKNRHREYRCLRYQKTGHQQHRRKSTVTRNKKPAAPQKERTEMVLTRNPTHQTQ